MNYIIFLQEFITYFEIKWEIQPENAKDNALFVNVCLQNGSRTIVLNSYAFF